MHKRGGACRSCPVCAVPVRRRKKWQGPGCFRSTVAKKRHLTRRANGGRVLFNAVVLNRSRCLKVVLGLAPTLTPVRTLYKHNVHTLRTDTCVAMVRGVRELVCGFLRVRVPQPRSLTPTGGVRGACVRNFIASPCDPVPSSLPASSVTASRGRQQPHRTLAFGSML